MASPDKPQTTKNRHFSQAFRHALDGCLVVVKEERNMRSHLVSALVVILVGWLLQVSLAEWCWLILAITIVWLMEFLNTMIEAIVDLIVGDRFDPLAKKAKDVAAGLVLMAAAFAVVIGLLVFVPHLLTLLK